MDAIALGQDMETGIIKNAIVTVVENYHQHREVNPYAMAVILENKTVK